MLEAAPKAGSFDNGHARRYHQFLDIDSRVGWVEYNETQQWPESQEYYHKKCVAWLFVCHL